MSARNILMAAGGSADDKLYVDDVFSAYTYTGNGSAQTINNGIDLAGKGGLVWTKGRSDALFNALFDTSRGVTQMLQTDNNGAQAAQANAISAFNATGFTTGANVYTNNAGSNYVSWTFRKAPKFFDVVTYTGNGNARTIAHSLGVGPGLLIIKGATSLENWQVWHKDFFPANNSRLYLNTMQGIENLGTLSPPFWGGGHTATAFSTGPWSDNNATGVQYVAYLFAHDPSADGIVQCGSFTTDSMHSATVALGWEPQYLMIKASSAAEDWEVYDTARGLSVAANSAVLYPNLASAENNSGSLGWPTATGFRVNIGLAANTTYIYLAIRRPNKPPTTGTEVYNAIARTGTGAAATVTGVGFAPDAVITQLRAGNQALWNDRLRGAPAFLQNSSTSAEGVDANSVSSFGMDGFSLGTSSAWNQVSQQVIHWNFRRALGFFDVVCYTGTGADRNVPHSLGVVPEMMIVKSRSTINNWTVFSNDVSVGSGKLLFLDTSTGPQSSAIAWNNTSPSASVFTVGTDYGTNQSGDTFVAYLFASLPGISKVGSYTGNGSSQTINCGFTTGARFILIKKTGGTGDWLVADTARGIVSAGDPRLSLNTSAAEVTGEDWLDPNATGFTINQTAADANASGASYIFLAIA